MTRLAQLSAQSMRAATGTYVFQLRDRFDESLPPVQLGMSTSSWAAVGEAPGPVEALVFHPGDKGLGLVTKEGGRFVPNPKAETAQEILTYLKKEHSYGEKVTGGKLTEEFGGLGYGWTADIVRLIVAVLFRAGQVEVTHQGRRYRNYQEPQARAPFSTTPAFRSASFSPGSMPMTL